MRRRFADRLPPQAGARLRTAVLSALLALAAVSPAPLARAAEGGAAPEAELTPQQRAELAATGQQLAIQRCQSCHAIDRTAASTNPDAPPFRDFADKWPAEDLEEALAEGIVTGHEEMPEFVFTTDEIVAFIEFLSTLQPPQ